MPDKKFVRFKLNKKWEHIINEIVSDPHAIHLLTKYERSTNHIYVPIERFSEEYISKIRNNPKYLCTDCENDPDLPQPDDCYSVKPGTPFD